MSDATLLTTAPITRPWWQQQAHYGWLTIIIGAVAMTATYPGRTHGLGMVTEPLLHDLGLADAEGRVFYAQLNLWGTLLGALFCLPVGWLFDRVNARVLLAANLLLLGASVFAMSLVQSWEMLFVYLILTRGFGQSALSVVSITIVAKAFRPQQLGLAMAWYAMLAFPFHGLLIKLTGNALSAEVPWRTVWATIGGGVAALACLALVLRPNRFAEEGTLADRGATLGQALRTPAFWVFAGTISLWGAIYAGVALFNQDIFAEREFAKEVYYHVLLLGSFVTLLAKFVFGWLTRYVRLTHLLGICLLLTAMSLAVLPRAAALWHIYVYAVIMGIASGAVALLFFAVWGKYYGPRQLGQIQGVAQMLTVLASDCGPLVFAAAKRATGSYLDLFQWLAGGVLVLALVAMCTPLPKFLEKQP